MNIAKFFVGIFFFCATSFVFAGPAATELEQLLAGMSSVSADFQQTIRDERGRVLQISSGNMALQRPGKFRWDVEKPLVQLIITNGKRLWVYDPDLEQVTIRSLSEAAGDAPALLLSRTNVALEDDFSVRKIHSPQSDLNWFSLVPKNQDSMFSSIKLGFFARNLQEMQLVDNLGHVTQVKLKNVKLNVEFNPSQFQFTPPSDVDVIDETARHHVKRR